MSYQIDRHSDWKLLPWHKINTRVVLLQRKIFEASKQCNLKKIHEMQNHFINSYEVRLNAVNQITYAINNYYKYENYSYNDLDKFNLFKNLFNDPKFIRAKLKLVIERIKEYLIYLCLQAEWQARSFDNLDKSKQVKSYDMIISHNNWLYTIRNKNNLPYINLCIDYWIKNYYIVYDQDSCFKYLYHLLIYIDRIKFSWYRIKEKKIYYDHNINSYELINCDAVLQNNKITNEIILINHIKTRIYKKDLLSRYRINKNLSWKLILEIMIRETNKFFCNQIVSFNLKSFFYLLNQINYLISYLRININKKNIYNTLYCSQSSICNILYRKKISICLNHNLFKIAR